MSRLFVSTRLNIAWLVLAAAAAAAFGAPPPDPDATGIQKLIDKLGSPEFSEREAATTKLEEIGTAAIEMLRKACLSDDPEVVGRARELLRKAERKLSNEQSLAPTFVRLDARDVTLDSLLDDLSRQASCEVVLGGPKPEDSAARRLTISTNGPMPLWAAIQKICDSADLQVSVVAGYVAPGATPYSGRVRAGVRGVRNTDRAIVLEPRGSQPKRPAAVQGAVLVEAIPFPKNTTTGEPAAVLIQVWPEPRLAWQAVWNVKVATAADENGKRMRGDYVAPKADSNSKSAEARDGVTFIRNPDGTFSIARGVSLTPAGLFAPSTRQAVLRVSGVETPRVLKNLDLVIYATMRSGVEPLAQVREMKENQAVDATGQDAVLVATWTKEGNPTKHWADVTLKYDGKTVQPATLTDVIPGVKGTVNLGAGNHTVSGLMVTDASGKPFDLGLVGSTEMRDKGVTTVKLTMELVPDRNSGPPASVTFWGTHEKQVDVSVRLVDVPVSR